MKQKFDPKEKCPKCGSVIEIIGLTLFGFHIKLQCQGCKHKFKRKALDKK